MCELTKEKIVVIEEQCGFKFKDKELLNRVFTHSSYANEKNLKHNAVLATLGDAIHRTAAYLYVFEKVPGISSSELSKVKTDIDKDEIFSKLEVVDKLYEHVRKKVDSNKPSIEQKEIRASLYESLCYAIYKEEGIYAVIAFITKQQKEAFDLIIEKCR